MSAKHIIPPLSPIAVGICAVTLRFGTCQVAGGKSAKIRILPCSPAYFGTCLRVHQPQPRLANRWLERLAQWVLQLRLAQWVLRLHLAQWVLRLRLAQWALQLHLSPTSLTGWRRPREAKIHQSHLVSAGKIDYGEYTTAMACHGGGTGCSSYVLSDGCWLQISFPSTWHVFYKSETEQQYVHKVGHRSQHVTTQCHSNKNLLGTYPLASILLALWSHCLQAHPAGHQKLRKYVKSWAERAPYISIPYPLQKFRPD